MDNYREKKKAWVLKRELKVAKGHAGPQSTHGVGKRFSISTSHAPNKQNRTFTLFLSFVIFESSMRESKNL